MRSVAAIRKGITGSDLAGGRIKTKVQHAYSRQSCPQVIGAAQDALGSARSQAEVSFVHRSRDLFPAHRPSYGADVRERLEQVASVSLDDHYGGLPHRGLRPRGWCVPIVKDDWLAKAPRRTGELERRQRYARPQHSLGDVLKKTAPVRPRQVAFFAAALDLTKMGLSAKLFVMLVIGGGPGDARHWEALRAWARPVPGVLVDS